MIINEFHSPMMTYIVQQQKKTGCCANRFGHLEINTQLFSDLSLKLLSAILRDQFHNCRGGGGGGGGN
ncbi:hypothetical protein DERF_004567 [Dermatophagoides farinae]|uniref:Uncharacterized protein n=1 Tax=Dermatophagoides farinae TaxID=6954 RepID=A0A922L6B9_DERFA|nr:hypothetical protein DERF_004567 [Dermatophagoides farinae]